MTVEMAKVYHPEQVESQAYRRWLDRRAFHADPDADTGREPYAIVIPPPNVTGALHMGHALNNTLQDILIRFRRMQGRNALWMPGTDHAGIATQSVVEKRVLAEEGKRRTDFEREAFVKKIQAWKDEYETRITEQLHAMGCSCDWERQRFTMDSVCAAAVREAFFRLFKDGLIYRGKRLVNWDPETQTALADDEVEMREIDGHFWYLKYPLTGPVKIEGQAVNHVTVATTRPETMLGDTAVAINPKDPRAPQLIGKEVRLPIVNRIIPIIEDDYVVLPDADSDDAKAQFATGFLKVTPAHDPNDWEIGLRHNLNVINVFAPDGSISNEHGWEDLGDAGFLLGQQRDEGCKAIVQWFEEHDLLEEVKPYRHAVGHSYRSHVPIEPYLSDQWYVKITDDRLAGAALRAMNKDQRAKSDGCVWKEGGSFNDRGDNWEGRLTFSPDRYAKTFQSWHENIRDWCISRQLWWGHRISVWSSPVAGFGAADKVAELQRLCREWEQQGRIAKQQRPLADFCLAGVHQPGEPLDFICIRDPEGEDREIIDFIEQVGYERDPDVLDTWFSSALWPLSTMGWPDESDLLKTFNPGSVLCTAREIITLWVSRMVMFNLYFRDCLPFYDVFIHAMIQDGQGQKMSKSLGNGVDPLDIIHSHGADAMRFTLASMTTLTQDVRMPVDVVCPHTGEAFEPRMITDKSGHRVTAPIQPCPTDASKKMITSYGIVSGQATPSEDMPAARNTSSKFDVGRNFTNKLWNASRFALMNLEEATDEAGVPESGPDSDDSAPLAWEDRWILSRLSHTAATVTGQLDEFKFSEPINALYRFFWNELCDWYLEIIKPRMRDNEQRPVAQKVLAYVFDATLRLLHPFMPFITEYIYQELQRICPERGLGGVAKLPGADDLILAAWPRGLEPLMNHDIQNQMLLMQETIRSIRDVRTRYKIGPREKFDVTIKASGAPCQTLTAQRHTIMHLANLGSLCIDPDAVKPENAAVAVNEKIEVYVHDVIDADAELERLHKQKEQTLAFISKTQAKLANENFVNRAKPEVVQRERDRLVELQEQLTACQKNLEDLHG